MVCSFYSFHLLPPFPRFSKAPPPECWGVSVASLPWHSFNGWNMLEPRKLSPAEEMILSFLPIKRICKVNDGEWNTWNLHESPAETRLLLSICRGKRLWLTRWEVTEESYSQRNLGRIWNNSIMEWCIYIYNIEAWIDGTLRIDNTP